MLVEGGEDKINVRVPLALIRTGIQLTTAAPLIALVLALGGWLSVPAALALFAATTLGLYWYEQAFVRAGQLPPLS